MDTIFIKEWGTELFGKVDGPSNALELLDEFELVRMAIEMDESGEHYFVVYPSNVPYKVSMSAMEEAIADGRRSVFIPDLRPDSGEEAMWEPGRDVDPG